MVNFIRLYHFGLQNCLPVKGSDVGIYVDQLQVDTVHVFPVSCAEVLREKWTLNIQKIQ
jgi:hypothetical protein